MLSTACTNTKTFGTTPNTRKVRWTASDRHTEDAECKKKVGRFPSAVKWNLADEEDAFKCCKAYNCAEQKARIDCRQYPVPEGLTQEKWRAAMTAAFGSEDVLVGKLPTGSRQEEAGHRAVSLETLEKIEQAAKGLFERGRKLKVVNKRFYPDGVDKSYEDLTMHDINGLVGMPLAASSQRSFAEHVAGGKPMFFISHNWEGRFSKFVESAKNHFNAKQKDVGGHLYAQSATLSISLSLSLSL